MKNRSAMKKCLGVIAVCTVVGLLGGCGSKTKEVVEVQAESVVSQTESTEANVVEKEETEEKKYSGRASSRYECL